MLYIWWPVNQKSFFDLVLVDSIRERSILYGLGQPVLMTLAWDTGKIKKYNPLTWDIDSVKIFLLFHFLACVHAASQDVVYPWIPLIAGWMVMHENGPCNAHRTCPVHLVMDGIHGGCTILCGVTRASVRNSCSLFFFSDIKSIGHSVTLRIQQHLFPSKKAGRFSSTI